MPELNTREEYLEAVKLVRQAAEVYENSEAQPLMDDYTYDMLMRDLSAAEATNPEWKIQLSPTETVGAGVNLKGDVIHSAPMLSLDNVFNEAELLEWGKRLDKSLGHKTSSYVIEPKLDGLALSARYVDGKLDMLLLRGSGTAGEDVSHNAKNIKGLPLTLNEPLTVEVRGECFLSVADLAEANRKREEAGDTAFVNARNGAAGAVRAKSRSYAIPLSFYAYSLIGYDHLDHSEAMSYISSLGVLSTADSEVGLIKAETIEEVSAAIKALGVKRPTLSFEIDGAVVKADKAIERQEAGFTNRAPRWGIAWKYPPDTRKTVLKEIVLQVGRTGAITPVAEFEPVFVGGSTLSRATLHNSERIAAKDLREGDTVWVRKAGDVIPEVVAVDLDSRTEEQVEWKPPTACPACGGSINSSQKVWRCSKGRDCGLIASVDYFGSKKCLDIEDLGGKLSEALVTSGLVKDLGDLYSLTLDDLLKLERVAETSANNLLAELEKSKQQPLSRVFCGLGIRLTGGTMSNLLAQHFGTMDALEAASVEDLAKLEGFAQTRAESIYNGIKEMKPVIDKLRAAGLRMDEPGRVTGGRFSNEDGSPMSILVTGTIPGYTRQEAQDAVRKMGGKPSSSVSKRTSFAIVGEGSGSKGPKAKELGVTIITGEDFATMISA